MFPSTFETVKKKQEIQRSQNYFKTFWKSKISVCPHSPQQSTKSAKLVPLNQNPMGKSHCFNSMYVLYAIGCCISFFFQFIIYPMIKQTHKHTGTCSSTHTYTLLHEFGRLPRACGGNINKEIEESEHKWGPTLLSLTIHFPITSGDTSTNWSPPSFHKLRIEVDTNNNTHLPSIYLIQTKMHAAVDLPAQIWNSLSQFGGLIWIRWTISNYISDRIWHHKHIRACLWNQIPRKMLK